MGCGGSKAKQSGMKIVTPADAATRRKTVKSTGESTCYTESVQCMLLAVRIVL